ncbi:MAG: hypothetical protein JO219_08050 [Candidatus Eremiobacteraeota bacterium]|nr:hypothetical protein [Candidatus Eremiobacteraeota bacterium]MBV8367184.1 hypothetical protein [Candidatus Eremiobacteraeota bacterium]
MAVLLISAIVMQALTSSAKTLSIETQPAGYSYGPANKSLELSVKLSTSAVTVGAPIAVTFAIENLGPPIKLFRMGSIKEYVITGTDPNGAPIKQGGPGILFAGSVPDGYFLDTGQAYVLGFEDLGQAYNFKQQGQYTFFVQTAVTLGYGSPVYVVLKSNTVTLKVQ